MVLKINTPSLFKTNTRKQTMCGRGKKLSKSKAQTNRKPFISEENKKNKKRIIRDIRTLFKTEEEKKRKELEKKKKHNKRLIKDGIIRDIRRLFEQEDDYYKPERVRSLWNNNYFEYESNGDKNGNLSLDKYLNKIKPYLRNIIIDLQNSET